MTAAIRALALGVLTASFGGLTLPSLADCGGPHVFSGGNPQSRPNETLVSEGRGVISGIGFGGCDDTPGGCGSDDASDPYDQVDLTLRGPVNIDVPGGRRTVDLGTIDVESDGSFVHTLELPKLPVGSYEVLFSGRAVGTVPVVKRIE